MFMFSFAMGLAGRREDAMELSARWVLVMVIGLKFLKQLWDGTTCIFIVDLSAHLGSS